MARLNKTVLFGFLSTFLILLGLQMLRENALKNQEAEASELQNVTINYYTVERPPQEVKLRNHSIETKLENGNYCVGYRLLEAKESYRDPDLLEPVSLVTHATSSMIDSIENLPYIWDGPISLAIFLDSQSEHVLEYLADVYRCDIRFRRKARFSYARFMTVHFAFLKNSSEFGCPIFKIPDSNRTCQQFFAQRESDKDTLRSAIIGPFQRFPINLMRNIARKGALSDIHFLMDQKMTPSKNFATEIKAVANKIIDGKHKRILAIRRFETEVGAEIPRNPKELWASKKAQKTFEFHHRYYTPGYYMDGLEEWFRKANQTNMVTSSRVQYPGYVWEVQPILHKNDSYSAAYFPAKVKTMHSLIYELCRAEYSFHVPSHVFSVHDGIQHANTIYSKTTVTQKEATAMITAREKFRKEMDEKYRYTQTKCGDFSLL